MLCLWVFHDLSFGYGRGNLSPPWSWLVLLLLFDLLDNFTSVDLNFFKDVWLVVFSLDLDGFVDHFWEFPVSLIEFFVSLDQSFISRNVWFVFIFHLKYSSLKLGYLWSELLLVFSKLFVGLCQLIVDPFAVFKSPVTFFQVFLCQFGLFSYIFYDGIELFLFGLNKFDLSLAVKKFSFKAIFFMPQFIATIFDLFFFSSQLGVLSSKVIELFHGFFMFFHFFFKLLILEGQFSVSFLHCFFERLYLGHFSLDLFFQLAAFLVLGWYFSIKVFDFPVKRTSFLVISFFQLLKLALLLLKISFEFFYDLFFLKENLFNLSSVLLSAIFNSFQL